MSTEVATPRATRESTVTSALDLVLALLSIAVPLVFTTRMRSFAAAKLTLLEIGVGIALVLAGFATRQRMAPLQVAGFGTAVLALTLLARPDPEGLAAVGWFVALSGFAVLFAMRSPHWSDRRVLAIVAIPLAVGIACCAAQAFGVAVLDATVRSFGGAHGTIVGTIGNPVENAWWLVLGVVLLHGLAPRRAAWITAVLVALIVLDSRSRATAAVSGLAVVLALAWRGTVWARLAAVVVLIAAGLAFVEWGGVEALRGRWFLLGVGADMLRDAALVPQGGGAFARDFPAAQQAALTVSPTLAPFASVLDHAHCDLLELAYELGLPGIAGLGWIGHAVVVAWRRDPSPRRRGAVWTLAVGVALGVFGYPLFSPACAMTLAIAIGLALAPSFAAASTPWPQRTAPSRPLPWSRALGSLGWVAVGGCLVVLGTRQAAAELAMTSALVSHDDGDDTAGRAHAQRAVALFPSADAWFYLGNFELARGDVELAAAAYRRSLALRPRAQTAANLRRTGGR